jgi:hypothetical protein
MNTLSAAGRETGVGPLSASRHEQSKVRDKHAK